MIKVLAVVALVTVAQIIPSCGDDAESRAQVIGYVDEKRHRIQEVSPFQIVINNLEYGVPYTFWLSVGVGDLVKYDGRSWAIVRKAGS